MLNNEYINKVYAGFLAMNAGIRLGAPVEPTEWNPKTIKEAYGEITDYTKQYEMFSADDDANGPIFFVRALIDKVNRQELSAQDVANAWLNYTRENIGMFWWGGEGVSTEHTAYNNLIKGINAPQSGSIDTNGQTMAEQVGGQIFVDTWGWLFPGNIEKAAEYAEIAASVSHDGEGLFGARFIAACIASAFDKENIKDVIEDGLRMIPEDSLYAKVTKAVLEFNKQEPDDFMACRDFLEAEWGYDKYPGVCHIIPNAGVCVLSLVYGNGDIAKTIEIATMCGWDTDSNAGNVGSIVGTLSGIHAFPKNYRKPMNDTIAASSVSGYLNILDVPTFVKEIALLSYEINEQKAPQQLVDSFKEDMVYFDFALKGSTHGFHADPAYKVVFNHRDTKGYQSDGVLEIYLDRFLEDERCKVFYKTFYNREQFNDEKYKPTFAPKAYSGQEVSMKLYLNQAQGEEVYVIPYVLDSFSRQPVLMIKQRLENNAWNDIRFTIPDLDGALVKEVGFFIESPSPRTSRTFGKILLDEFCIKGASSYTIDLAKQNLEFMSVTPFAHHNGDWNLLNGSMHVATCSDKGAKSFTGHYYEKDYQFTTSFIPLKGNKHQLIFRSEGVMKHYEIGFSDVGKVSINKENFGNKLLQELPFDWQLDQPYEFTVKCIKENISFYINGEKVLEHVDDELKRGMVGVSVGSNAEAIYHEFTIKGM